MIEAPPETGAFLLPGMSMPPAPPPAAAPDRGQPAEPRTGAWGLAAIVALGLVAYSNALGGDWVFDDLRQIRDNPLVRDLGNYLSSWTGYRALPNRYVGYLTFALNYRLGGTSVTGYHLVNVLVHVANALLVHALVVLTFRTPRLEGSALRRSSGAIAFAAAALFVAHPLQTQAVSYVVQRLTSLATTFYLATVVLHVASRLDEAPRPRWRRAAMAAATFATAALAMKTKEIAFTLPIAVALYELSFLEGAARRRLRSLAPVLATLPIIPLSMLLAQGAGSAHVLSRVAAATRVDTPLPRLEYLTTQLVVVVKYLALLAFPAGQNVDHHVAVHRSLAEPAVAASLAVLVALAATGAILWRRAAPGRVPAAIDPAARLVAFGIAWFFVALLVESSLIPISDLMNEHRAYLPSVGIFVAAPTGLAALLRRIPRASPGRITLVAGALVAVVLSIATLLRNQVWASELTLWSDAALKSPRKPRPLVNLGSALALAGRPDLGVGPLRRAVELDPAAAYPRAQLAAALLALGRAGEAEPELRAVLRLAPDDPEAAYNLASLLWARGVRDEARTWFRRFLEVAPPAYAGARRIAAARLDPANP